jgi:hypothetical protein
MKKFEAHILLETSVEVVIGLIKALDHYEKRSEA